MGGIQNCPVRVEDIKIAENIFGPDMATLKGKVQGKHQNQYYKIELKCQGKFWRSTARLSYAWTLCMSMVLALRRPLTVQSSIGLLSTLRARNLRIIWKHLVLYWAAITRQDITFIPSIVIGSSSQYSSMRGINWSWPLTLQIPITIWQRQNVIIHSWRRDSEQRFTFYRLKPSPGLW